MAEQPCPSEAVDVQVTDRGSAWLFLPVSERADAWMTEHMGMLSDAQRQGNHFAVDISLAVDVVRQMEAAGFLVKEECH
jgi:hypothetical protein